MPSKNKSPYATSFTTAVKNGTPCSTVVWNISKKTNKSVSTIWNSLYSAGVCSRQKFNGTWVYWPTFNVKKNTTARNTTQANMWQSFIEWCMTSGYCTTNQLTKNSTNQKNFMSYCRSFFGKQYSWSAPKTSTKSVSKRYPSSKTRKTTSTWKTTNWTSKHTNKKNSKSRKNTTPSWSATYKFPTYSKTRSTSVSRRYRHAA